MLLPHRLSLLLACAVGALALGGCEEEVDPFIEGDFYYSIYGYLDTAADTQYVRVVPISDRVGESEGLEGAVVRSVRLADGETVVWRDSLVTFRDGSTGTVFYAPVQIFPGYSYRFEVERSDGATTSAQTDVPAPQQVEVGSVTAGNTRQTVRWPGITSPPFRAEVWYRFRNRDPRRPFQEIVLTYAIDIERTTGRTSPQGGWQLDVLLSDDYELVRERLGFAREDPPTLLAVGMRLADRDAQWVPPGGRFDSEVLVQPGLFSNVENGFGFLGSVNNASAEWTLSESATNALGYAFPR
jgi:hypothetical protein